MKKYICLNHGECQYADEIPPREFELKDGDINCTNCGSANIREAIPPSGIDWKKIVIGVVAVLLLVFGIIWALTPPSLRISVEANCTSNSVAVLTMEGNGEPIVLYSPELGRRQADSVFRIPVDKRSGVTLTFWAVQGSDSVKASLVTKCEKSTEQGPEFGSGPEGPQSPEKNTNPSPVVRWRSVADSEFCDPDANCVQYYSERNNLGQIRERKRTNCAECGKAENDAK